MQKEYMKWQAAFRVLLAVILSLGGFSLQGCDWSVSISTNATATNDDQTTGQPPDETTGEVTPTTSAGPTTEPGTTGPDGTTTEPSETTTGTTESTSETTGNTEPEQCGNNGVPFEDALVWPICLQDSPEIEEGWIYSEEEQKIHGSTCHKALDIKAAYGTEVRAMTGGWCLASFESAPGYGTRGQKIGFGGGLLVVCWSEEFNVFIQYLHLSALGQGIPYYDPTFYTSGDGFDSWSPSIIQKPSYEFIPNAVYLEEGELIGNVGVSGLSHDGNDEPSPNPPMVTSWDGPHVHIQIHGDRIWDDVAMVWKKDPTKIYDPIGLYTNFEDYWDVFLFCYGMIACDVENFPAPRFPLQCGNNAANDPPANEVPFEDAA